MKKKMLVVTQTVDLNDPILGFFHRWLQVIGTELDLVVIANSVGKSALPSNVELYSLGKETGIPRLLRWMIYIKLLFQMLPGIDGIFFHMNPEYPLAAGLLPKIFRKRSILWYTHRNVSWKLRIAEKLVDSVFTAAPGSFRLASNKVIVTGHGIDTELFTPFGENRKEQKTTILSIGRISPIKNYDKLVLAANELRVQGTDFQLIIVGPVISRDLGYFEYIQKLVATNGLEEHVFLTGSIPYEELPDLYHRADIFISLTTSGSLDKVLLEAGACGIPVITANSDLDFIEHITLTKNDPQDLVRNIIEVLQVEIEPSIRDYVVSNHSLNRLAGQISKWVEDISVNG